MEIKIEIKIEISDAAFELLKRLKKEGSLEYKDSEYISLDEYRKYNSGDEERFLSRNSDGTLYLMEELLEHDLVDCDINRGLTFTLTELGENVLQKYT